MTRTNLLRVSLVCLGFSAWLLCTFAAPVHADARMRALLQESARAEISEDYRTAIARAESALQRAETVDGIPRDDVAKILRVLERLYRLADRPQDAAAMERRLATMTKDAAQAEPQKEAARRSGSGLPGTPRSNPPTPAPAPAVAPPPPPRPLAAAPPPPTDSAPASPPAPTAAPPSAGTPRTKTSLPPPAPGSTVANTQSLDPSRFAQVPVFFGTTRARGLPATRNGADPLATFTNIPAIDLTLGAAVVSVPRQGRDKGEIPLPRAASFWRAAETQDPNLHFMLVSVDTLTREVFVSRANARLLASEGVYKDQAFVFVHGFNVSFEDAIYRTAQIAYDLDFTGAPFLYSWPTLEGVFGYFGAKDRALASRAGLRDFLDLVSQKTSAKRIHLIAHSMGTWPLLDVLREIAATDVGKAAPRFREVILVAPDMDRENFATLAARVCPARTDTRCAGGAAEGVTFYATSNDRALLASFTLASGIDRAGLFDEKRPFVVKNIDTIDVSAADTSVFSYNHSQPLERRQLLRDIGALLASSVRPPHSRTPAYEQRSTSTGDAYWSYLKKP
jgi:esterase/lipase superfamily enzyme